MNIVTQKPSELTKSERLIVASFILLLVTVLAVVPFYMITKAFGRSLLMTLPVIIGISLLISIAISLLDVVLFDVMTLQPVISIIAPLSYLLVFNYLATDGKITIYIPDSATKSQIKQLVLAILFQSVVGVVISTVALAPVMVQRI